MNLPQKNDLYLLVLTIVTLPVTIYSYLMVPFATNQHAYFAAAKLADFYGNFPSNVDMSWESRPIISRMIFYGLYKLCEPFKNNELLFQISTKAAVAVVILCVCAYMAYEIHKKSKHLNIYISFLVASLAIFTLHTLCTMESEFFAAIGSFLAIALLLSESRWANGVAGVVMVGVFLLKGLTGVMIPVIVISCFLFDKENIVRKLKYVFIGLIISGTVFLISWLLWFPNFIPDIKFLFEIANPQGYTLIELMGKLAIKSRDILWFIPILSMGVVALVCVVWEYMKSKEFLMAAAQISMWVLATSLVILQGEFMYYHYLLLIIPAVISILLLLTLNYGENPLSGTLMVVVVTLCIWFVLSALWASGGGIFNNRSLEDDNIQRIIESTVIKQTYIPDREEPVLYLDYDSAYFLGNPTACRHPTAAAMCIAQNFNWNLTKTKGYKDELECALNFNGKHIIIRPLWFGTRHEPINKKVTEEYHLVFTAENWDIYERNTTG